MKTSERYPGLPSWLDSFELTRVEWHGVAGYFGVLPVSRIDANTGQVEGLPANPRRWTADELAALKASLKETPELTLARGVLVYPHGDRLVALGGNMRQAAAKALKEKDLPAFVFPEDTPAGKLMGNAEEAEKEGSEEKREQHECENREDNTDGMTVEKRAFPGAIFALDGHRLMCGDATDPAAYNALLKAAGVEKVDLALTDPPYGINVVKKDGTIGDSSRVAGRDVLNEKATGRVIKSSYFPVIGDESTETARKAIDTLQGISSFQIVFGGNYFTDFLPPSRCWIVWDKVNGESDFADVELAWANIDTSARLFKHLWNGAMRAGDHEAEGRTRLHPTQKPVGLLTAIVEKLFPSAETILDPFAGSGSTLIAAERLGKRCFAMELSVDYVDVILARWERFTGKKAELLNPGEIVPQGEK